MQIGSRWVAGGSPHHAVPEYLYELIRTAEARHPDSTSWTLTWLEGLPVCALNDVAMISIGKDGQASLNMVHQQTMLDDTDDDNDDDWLSNS